MEKVFAFVVPVYNSEKYLEDCLNSILQQTYKNFFIYAVDDCSTDASFQILQRFRAKDERLILLKTSSNVGVSAARNYALEQIVENDLISHILFVDSDDKVAPDLLSTFVAIPWAFDYAVFGTEFFSVKGVLGKKFPHKECLLSKSEAISQLFLLNDWKNYSVKSWGVLNKVFSKQLVGRSKFREDLNLAEDLEFVLRLFSKLKTTVVFTNKTLYYYRIRSSSITHSPDQLNFFETLQVFIKLMTRQENRSTSYYQLATLQLAVSLYPRICLYAKPQECKIAKREFLPLILSEKNCLTPFFHTTLIRTYFYTPCIFWRWLCIYLNWYRRKVDHYFP